MKQTEFVPCSHCGRGVMHPPKDGELFGNAITFYRMKVEYMAIDVNAVRRQDGFERFVGNPAVAQILGPNEDLATTLVEDDLIICMECMMSHCGSLPGVLEHAAKVRQATEVLE